MHANVSHILFDACRHLVNIIDQGIMHTHEVYYQLAMELARAGIKLKIISSTQTRKQI